MKKNGGNQSQSLKGQKIREIVSPGVKRRVSDSETESLTDSQTRRAEQQPGKKEQAVSSLVACLQGQQQLSSVDYEYVTTRNYRKLA